MHPDIPAAPSSAHAEPQSQHAFDLAAHHRQLNQSNAASPVPGTATDNIQYTHPHHHHPQPDLLNQAIAHHDAMVEEKHFEPTDEDLRPHSPINESVPIPDALKRLAESTQSVDIPTYDMSEFTTENVSDRGEMGGKRKKQPHERAGWKEMDEQGLLKKRHVGGRKKQTIDEFLHYAPHDETAQPSQEQQADGSEMDSSNIGGIGVGVGNAGYDMTGAPLLEEDKRLSKWVTISER